MSSIPSEALIAGATGRVQFRDEAFTPTPLAQNEQVKVMVVGFEPGQFIPVHAPEVNLTLVVLEGRGRVVAGDDEQPAAPGTVIFAPAGAERGVKAETRLVAISIVAPPPTDADHAQVRAGLKAGTWRP